MRAATDRWCAGQIARGFGLGLVLLGVGMARASVPESAQEGPAVATERAGWELVWADEFDTPGAPDPARWDYEEGFVRNQEAQYYTRARLENARVEDGRLIIEGRKETWANPDFDPALRERHWRHARPTAEYTSAALITRGLGAWQYGRIEVRARVPQGKGVWPAIWMLGDNRSEVGWPRCGEIDIMEYVGHDPQRIHGNIHFPRQDGRSGSQQRAGRVRIEGLGETFHVYAIEWSEEAIDFFVDDQRYHRVDLAVADSDQGNPFRQPFYLLLNLALGGSWGREIEDPLLPLRFEVDYVRIYQRLEPRPKTPAGEGH